MQHQHTSTDEMEIFFSLSLVISVVFYFSLNPFPFLIETLSQKLVFHCWCTLGSVMMVLSLFKLTTREETQRMTFRIEMHKNASFSGIKQEAHHWIKLWREWQKALEQDENEKERAADSWTVFSVSSGSLVKWKWQTAAYTWQAGWLFTAVSK